MIWNEYNFSPLNVQQNQDFLNIMENQMVWVNRRHGVRICIVEKGVLDDGSQYPVFRDVHTGENYDITVRAWHIVEPPDIY